MNSEEARIVEELITEGGSTEGGHALMVNRLAKPGAAIITDLTPESAHLLHMAIGVSGEAGELLDCIKKHAIYGKELDLVNLEEELGDLEFYIQGIREVVGKFREGDLKANMMKLAKRYGKSYSNKAAQDRADKA